MKADALTEQAARACVNAFLTAYAERRMDAAMAQLAPDADVVLFGTGADEKRVGPAAVRAQLDRDWTQSEACAYAIDWSQVSSAGSVAWMASDGAFRVRVGGQDMAMPARATFVVEQRDGRWLVCHAHFSMPAAAQQDGESF
ncbi:nuclear transport factor 2 family protein [uncultured Piscinibacter sp.]|uniref:nuclear transport factor 2 family protein n=1 Tax=uncultured Piscinibacter sp. TaxID=1131835 RepID=UPI0026056E14|nr:nuclear transport factor 2 family protein [uncultured Piscinibacter sp.]